MLNISGGPRRSAPADPDHQRQLLHNRVHQLCQPLPHEGRNGPAQVHKAAGAALHPQERSRANGYGRLCHGHPRQDAGQRAPPREHVPQDGYLRQKRVLGLSNTETRSRG